MLGQIRVIQIRSTRSSLRNRRRGGARLKAMLSWWRRNRFSASSRHGGLNKSTMNIPSECRIASIGRDHAMILPHDANPKPDGIFGKDRRGWNVVEVYSDAGISGAKGRNGRPGLDSMLKDASRRRFDIVMAWTIDRLGRSLIDLLDTIQHLEACGVDLYLDQQAIDTTTPM